MCLACIGNTFVLNSSTTITMHYKFARTHKSLSNPYPATPVMAAGISDHVWAIEEIVTVSDMLK